MLNFLGHLEIVDIFGFVLPNRTIIGSLSYSCGAALCIKHSDCKLAPRKGAPLIAVKRKLTSVIQQGKMEDGFLICSACEFF